MNKISKFSLITHPTPPDDWPKKSDLLVYGELCGSKVPGYTLLQQFEVPLGYLLITDYDCPFEEERVFMLLDSKFRVISQRSFIAPYCSYLLKSIEWRDPHNFFVTFEGLTEPWQFTIRSWGIPYIRPRLKMRRIRS